MSKRRAVVDETLCVGCGNCRKACPREAIDVPKGIFAVVDETLCAGCGLCAKACPASVIVLTEREAGVPMPGKMPAKSGM